MATVLTRYCDIEYAQDPPVQVDAHQVTVSLNNGQNLLVDLCDQHEKEFITPLAEILAEFGSPIDTQPATSSGKRAPQGRKSLGSDFPCLWCEHAVGTDSGLMMHLFKKHELQNQGEAYGQSCPLCDHDTKVLSRHIKAEHGVNIAQGFEKAIEAGDPRGIVASRLLVGKNVERHPLT